MIMKKEIDNQGKPRKDYLLRIAAMSEAELLKESKDKIWLSAYASNNPRSDYHWQADACYAECQNRKRPDIYREAYEYNLRKA